MMLEAQARWVLYLEISLPRTAASIAHSRGDYRDQVQFAVAFSVVLTGRLWRARFADRMKALGQSDARWTALYMIADASRGIIQTDLAERLGVQGPTLVKLLDALEGQGLVRREPARGDRRVKLVFIEPQGSATLAEIDRFAAKMRDELFDGVSEEDLAVTLRVLNHLSSQLEPPLQKDHLRRFGEMPASNPPLAQ
jgi:MarR family transcriptional regulator for hemolysin